MKKIGLVGGTGPESTLMYYKEINSRIDEMTGNKAMPDIAIESVNFRKAWNMVVAEDYEALADYLSEKINFLKKSGSEVISLTAVTMHIVFDLIQEKTGVSLISIPMAVCNEVKRHNYKKIGLLGTIFTMEQDYMKKDFEQAGIEVIVPNEENRRLVAKRILEELEVGIVNENTLKEFNEIIDNMKTEHVYCSLCYLKICNIHALSVNLSILLFIFLVCVNIFPRFFILLGFSQCPSFTIFLIIVIYNSFDDVSVKYRP